MGRIINEGDLRSYSFFASLDNASGEIKHFAYAEKQITVFISHKHDDLDNLSGVIGLLEKEYNVKAYIDSKDPSLPETPSAETAKRIKERIDQCDKFILLATNKAIESKWCNWELGYGDAKKYKSKIALFPMQPKGNQTQYRGNEYMKIYPYISYYDGTTKYSKTNVFISKGFYVKNYTDNNPNMIIPLDKWLKQ